MFYKIKLLKNKSYELFGQLYGIYCQSFIRSWTTKEIILRNSLIIKPYFIQSKRSVLTRNFCREYGNPDISSISELMKQEKIPTSVEELQTQLVRERKEHIEELKRLTKALREEKLRSLANSTMIDLAERKFNIAIRKKSAAK